VQQVEDVVAGLRRRSETVCTVESLTGGLLCAVLTDVPGASQFVLGGIVAYTMDAKHDVVGVDEHLLAEHGAVSARAAQALAARARELFGSTWAVATTGVAGPATQEGNPVGTVFVAVDGPASDVTQLSLSGDRHQIRTDSCAQALELLYSLME
jgi:PncC family amidohydrolase